MFGFFRRLRAPKSAQPARPVPARATNADDIFSQTFRFIAVDVETANSDTSSICQLGLAMVTADARIHTLSFLIDPELPFAAANIAIHGIKPNDVRGRPTLPKVIDALRPFLERHPLIQHSTFDKTAITGGCRRYRIANLKAQWHDSVTIARSAWPQLRGNGGHGLANLTGFLDIDFQHHDAAEDAKAAALVVLHAEKATGQTFDALAAPKTYGAAQPPKQVALAGREGGAHFGQVVCFTGQIGMSRTEAATLAAGAGMTVKTTVSKKITILIVGDQDMKLLAGHDKSTKHRRAEELIAEGTHIRIIGETDFRRMIED